MHHISTKQCTSIYAMCCKAADHNCPSWHEGSGCLYRLSCTQEKQCSHSTSYVQVCARSSKFSLFDPAKEMAYIQMSRKEKSKGKAAVDLIGSQVQSPALSTLTLPG